MTYSQCLLTTPRSDGTTYATRVAWIPTKFAKVDKRITLHDEPEQWTVLFVGSQMSEEFVLARRDDYRYQRRVSDV